MNRNNGTTAGIGSPSSLGFHMAATPTSLPRKSLNADEYAVRHDGDLGFEAAIIRARQNCNLRSLASDPAKSVLEVGCGPKLLVQRAAARVPFDSWTIVEPASSY